MKDSEIRLTTQSIGLIEVFGREIPTNEASYFYQFKTTKRRAFLELLEQSNERNYQKPDLTKRLQVETSPRRYSPAQNQRRPDNSLKFRPGKSGMWPSSGA
jgi:hypothetical protein